MSRGRGDPDNFHPYKKRKPPKPASEMRRIRNGKIEVTLPLTIEQYEELRTEAIKRGIPLARVLRECLSAGLCPE